MRRKLNSRMHLFDSVSSNQIEKELRMPSSDGAVLEVQIPGPTCMVALGGGVRSETNINKVSPPHICYLTR